MSLILIIYFINDYIKILFQHANDKKLLICYFTVLFHINSWKLEMYCIFTAHLKFQLANFQVLVATCGYSYWTTQFWKRKEMFHSPEEAFLPQAIFVAGRNSESIINLGFKTKHL